MKTSCPYLILLLCLGCEDRSASTPAPTPTNNVARVDSRLASTLHAIQESNVTAVAFAPDGRLWATTNMHGTVRIWDVQSGKPLTSEVAQAWSAPLPRYDPKRIDNMPQVGPDNFKILQDQIDALEQRIEQLENKRGAAQDQP